MSYNPDSITRIAGNDLTIHADDIKMLVAKHERDLPGDCFLTDSRATQREPGNLRTITRLAWRSEGSGSSFDAVLVKSVLPRTRGTADFVVTWEGGDAHTGLRVIEGVVTQHEVVQALGAVIP